MKVTKEAHEQAIARLKELLPPGSTVYTSVKHVSRSGMSRSISCYAMVDNQPIWIDSLVSKATGLAFDSKREAIKIGGCGMDMGFAIVYELASVLYCGGWECLGLQANCPSNDHSNRVEPPENACLGLDHCTNRNCVRWIHKEPGYALRQRWL